LPAPLFRRILATIPALLLGGAAYQLGRLSAREPRPAQEPLALGYAGSRGFALAPPAPRPFRPWRRKAFGLVVLCILILGGISGVILWQHEVRLRHQSERAAALVAGDPSRAPLLMLRHGCAGCHAVPGLAGPQGMVGPALGGIGQRLFLAGRIANTPDNLVRWIRDPKGVDPKTAMPVTGISDEEARDVAAYLLAR
jgi:cytochrome c2